MAKSIYRLTDRQVRNATKPLNDGGNLWLYPRGGARHWFFRYFREGKAHEMSLGSYSTVTLEDAREEAGKWRKVLKKKRLDPIAERKRIEEEKKRVIPTFTQAAARYILTNRHEWKNHKHRRQWASTMKTYARPVIGPKRVDEVTSEDVQAILQPIWTSKTETAKRVQGRIESILDWATAKKYRSGDNPARWRGNLDMIFPKPSKVKKANNGGEDNHFKAMPYKQVPAFWQKVRNNDSVSSKALCFLILTGCRSREIRGATWDEINLEEKTWTIPAGRMKAGKVHKVPLIDPAIEILSELPRLNEYVFPGQRNNRPLSVMALLTVMRKLGYVKEGKHPPYVPHGFRSSFRDWVADETGYPDRLAEVALAHSVGSQVERAYQRSDMFEKRRKLMEEWGNYVALSAEGKVVSIHKSA